MRVHRLDIPFDRLALPTAQQLAMLSEALDGLVPQRPASRLRVFVYGMGAVGHRVYEHLEARPWVEIKAFDARGAQASATIPVLSPSNMARQRAPQVVVNTAPPRAVLASSACIEQAADEAEMVLWFDPFDYVEKAHDAYGLYFDSLQHISEAATAQLATAIRKHYLASAEQQWLDSGAATRDLASLLPNGTVSLGAYLDSALSDMLRREEAGTPEEQDETRISNLIDLAARFPFFTIALDAAACLLVRHDQFKRAAEVLSLAVQRYPHCYRTLAKLAELHLLTGNMDDAKHYSQRAAHLAASGSQLRQEYDDIPRQNKNVVLSKWKTRSLRPALIQRNATLHCAVPVWGAPFVDLFMRFTLRSLFAPGNLPFASEQTSVRFTIYTDEHDVERIKKYPEWEILHEYADVHLETIDSVLSRHHSADGNRYHRLSRCQDHALGTSKKEHMVTFFPLADLIFSSHFVQRGLELINSGNETVFFAGMRYSKEKITSSLQKYATDNCINVPSKTLFSYATQSIHPIYKNKIQETHVELHPNSFFSTDKNGNILQHFFAPTPMFISPNNEKVSISCTFDMDLGYSVTDGGLRNFCYITDTDSLLLLELTSEEANTGELQIPGEAPLAACANWIRHTIDPLNKLLGAHTVILRQNSSEKNPQEAVKLVHKVSSLLV